MFLGLQTILLTSVKWSTDRCCMAASFGLVDLLLEFGMIQVVSVISVRNSGFTLEDFEHQERFSLGVSTFA